MQSAVSARTRSESPAGSERAPVPVDECRRPRSERMPASEVCGGEEEVEVDEVEEDEVEEVEEEVYVEEDAAGAGDRVDVLWVLGTSRDVAPVSMHGWKHTHTNTPENHNTNTYTSSCSMRERLSSLTSCNMRGWQVPSHCAPMSHCSEVNILPPMRSSDSTSATRQFGSNLSRLAALAHPASPPPITTTSTLTSLIAQFEGVSGVLCVGCESQTMSRDTKGSSFLILHN
jgi:hypothetical protein